MKYYIVDFENVNTHGLNGIENIAEGDTVCIFYSDFANSISIDHHFAISQSKADISFQKVDVTGRNSLDFQLVSYLGYILCENKNKDTEFFIVSKDRAFESIPTYWDNKGYKISVVTDLNNTPLNEMVSEDKDSSQEQTDDEISSTEPSKPLSCRQKARIKNQQKQTSVPTPRERRDNFTKVYENSFSDNEFSGKKNQILNILCTGTTRCDVNTKLSKVLSGKEMKKLYKKFKPLLKDLPGQ